MRTTQIAGPGFSVTAPTNWRDITEYVEADNQPFTLAKVDGVGALQFSVALHQTGQKPNVSQADLLEMLDEFGKSHSLSRSGESDVITEDGDTCLAAATFRSKNDIVRAWYLSVCGNFAFITYVCGKKC